MKIRFSLRKKWKTISIYTRKVEYLIRFWSFYPFIKIDKFYDLPSPPKTK